MLDKGSQSHFTACTQNDSDDEPEFRGFIEDDVRLAEEALKEYQYSHHDILNWYSVDDICPIYEHISDDEIVANVSGKNEAAQPEPVTLMTTMMMMAPHLPQSSRAPRSKFEVAENSRCGQRQSPPTQKHS